MLQYSIEDIYMTLCGEIEEANAVPGVENAYADGSQCDRLYTDIYQAYQRLCQRLGVEDEDADVEIIIDSLCRIQEILCEKMFHYGATITK